jgi:nicotinic acid mononucleotide adenylyltransferase
MDLRPLLERVRAARRPCLELVPDPGAVGSLAMLAGSFDPITVGHEALAREALWRSEAVALVYSVRTLPKEGPGPPPLLHERARLHVLARFCAARPGHVIGLASHGLLAEQVDAAAELLPEARLWSVMGSDKLLQVLDPKWYADPDEALTRLFSKAGVLYADRKGDEGRVEAALPPDGYRAWRDRVEKVAVPPDVVSVSSRLVREMIRKGEAVDHLIPAEAREAVHAARERGG